MNLLSISVQKIAIISVAVVAWLFCAFSAAEIARTNGGSYNFWLLVGLMTGPLGLALTYGYYRLTGERYRRYRHGVGRRSDLPEMTRCPGCGEWVPIGYERCQFCGTEIHGKKRV